MNSKKTPSQSSVRRRPKQERAKVMVEAVLESTQLLLADVGYEATNTTRIAERAGMSIGSLYQYFSNRDEIIEELQRRHHHETSAIMEKAFAEAESLPLDDAIRRLVRATVDLHQNEPELHRVLTEVVPVSVNAESRAAMSEKIDAAQQRLFQRLASELPIRNITATALVIRETVEGSIHRAVLHGHSGYIDVVAEEVVRMVISYLRSHQTA
ncbi:MULTISPECIES: TetR/AcrR family transcriptional regulator [Cohaesibacter]|uniref:TetR/AcrR family transcriptional regulator n=1 Tax=Cohaesibacter TaxID=655352 RepID=UPI0014856912|nr:MULTISPECIES: TetR/AcrR family transcriptional regulator [Cohaesibacter]